LNERYGVKLDSSSVGNRSVADYCENVSEPLGYKKYENVWPPDYVWPRSSTQCHGLSALWLPAVWRT